MTLGNRIYKAILRERQLRKVPKETLSWQEWLDAILQAIKQVEYHPGHIPGPFLIPEHLYDALDGTNVDNIAAWSSLTKYLQTEDLVLRKEQLVVGNPSLGLAYPAYILVYVGDELPGAKEAKAAYAA